MTTIRVNIDELQRLANGLGKFDQELAEFGEVYCNGFTALLAEWQGGKSRTEVEQLSQDWERTLRHLVEQGNQLAKLLEHVASDFKQAEGVSF